METKGRQNQQNEESSGWLAKYAKSQGDWLEKTKGNFVVAATIIAAMSFQVMVSPPGGVWQNNEDGCREGQAKEDCPRAGTAVFAEVNGYILLVISSAVSFSASMFLILLLVSGARLRELWVMAILIVMMVAAVLCISLAFFTSVALVASNRDMVIKILSVYSAFWVLVPVILAIYKLYRLSRWYRRQSPTPGLRSQAI